MVRQHLEVQHCSKHISWVVNIIQLCIRPMAYMQTAVWLIKDRLRDYRIIKTTVSIVISSGDWLIGHCHCAASWKLFISWFRRCQVWISYFTIIQNNTVKTLYFADQLAVVVNSLLYSHSSAGNRLNKKKQSSEDFSQWRSYF